MQFVRVVFLLFFRIEIQRRRNGQPVKHSVIKDAASTTLNALLQYPCGTGQLGYQKRMRVTAYVQTFNNYGYDDSHDLYVHDQNEYIEQAHFGQQQLLPDP